MTTAPLDPATVERLHEAHDRILDQLSRVIVGQQQVVDELLICLFSRGHCLLEGVPGLAKTLLVSTLAKSLDLSFSRIQFTPDLMPADIVGTDVLEEDRATGGRQFRFLEGPLFANVVLADEINRTPPKTQAALLEAMQERQVSVGRVRHKLVDPFFVLATQNPIEQEGTYPLPEGQRDRFLMQIVVGYPARHEELEVVKRTTGAYLSAIAPVTGRDELQAAHEIVRAVPIAEHVLAACVDLARCSRPGDPLAPPWLPGMVRWGAGPRASQALALVAKATAAMAGRPAAELSDVRHLASAVLRHRLVLTFEAESDGVSADMIIERLIETRLS
jgi:MoxR-like ATPase